MHDLASRHLRIISGFPGPEKFQFVLKATGSRIKHHRINVHDFSHEVLGHFDLILFAGVLYHCRYPLIALEKIRWVTKGTLILETVTLILGVHGNEPLMMFFSADDVAGLRHSTVRECQPLFTGLFAL